MKLMALHNIYVYCGVMIQVPLHMVDVPVHKERGLKGTESRCVGVGGHKMESFYVNHPEELYT